MGTVTLQRIIAFRCGENDRETLRALAKLQRRVNAIAPVPVQHNIHKNRIKKSRTERFQKRLAALVAVKVHCFPMLLQVFLYQMNQMILIYLQIFNNRKMHQSSTASFIQNRDHLGRGLTVCVDVVFIKLLIWYAYSIKVMTRNVNENPLLGTYA